MGGRLSYTFGNNKKTMKFVIRLLLLFLVGQMFLHAHPVFYIVQSEKDGVYFKVDVMNMEFYDPTEFYPRMSGSPYTRKRDYKVTSKVIGLIAKDRIMDKDATYLKKASLIIKHLPSNTFKAVQLSDKEWESIVAYASKVMTEIKAFGDPLKASDWAKAIKSAEQVAASDR